MALSFSARFVFSETNSMRGSLERALTEIVVDIGEVGLDLVSLDALDDGTWRTSLERQGLALELDLHGLLDLSIPDDRLHQLVGLVKEEVL